MEMRRITINIAGRNYPLNVPAAEEETLRKVGKQIEAMIEARQLAREVRDFAKSDEIRDALKAQGIVLEDTKDGVRWHRE